MASMRLVDNQAVSVLMFLLPGFVSAGIYNSLIPRPVSDRFQIVVRAFIFTVFVQFFATLVLEISRLFEWSFLSSVTWEIVVLASVSVAVGIASAYAWNKDYFHKLLRRCKVTVESSYPSALYPAFALYGPCYVVMHLKGGHRLYGKPKEWPSRPDDRYFLIEECEWLVDGDRKPVKGVRHTLISESEVEMVEFLPVNSDTDLGRET